MEVVSHTDNLNQFVAEAVSVNNAIGGSDWPDAWRQ